MNFIEQSEDPPAPEPESVLEVTGLSVTIGSGRRRTEALRDVTLQVAPGEIVAVVGESGSGKSVLGMTIQALLPEGAHPHVTGSIKVGDAQMVGATERLARRVRRDDIGVVFQDPMSSLNPTTKVHHQVAEAAGDDERVPELLSMVGLEALITRPAAFPHELSGGQRQRAMLAMALARDPRLVIADEPTTALDVTVQAQILRLLLDLRDRSGCSFLFITHDLGVAAQIADRVIVMRAGRVLEQGSTASVLSAPREDYTRRLLRSRLSMTTPKDRPIGGNEDAHWPERAAYDDAKVLQLEGVGKRFGRGSQQVAAVEDVSLTLRRGRCLAIVGESGSGKSTLLRLIAGLMPVSDGHLRVSGTAQMVFQDASASLTPWLSLRALLRERLRRLHVPRAEWDAAIQQVLSVVGLEHDHVDARPGALSGGQAQRAAIARAVIRPPDVLLADEPTSALDVTLAATVLNLLVGLQRQLGLAMVFVTHDLAAARFLADDVVVLQSGSVVAQGSVTDVLDHPSDPYTLALLRAVPDLAGVQQGGRGA